MPCNDYRSNGKCIRHGTQESRTQGGSPEQGNLQHAHESASESVGVAMPAEVCCEMFGGHLSGI